MLVKCEICGKEAEFVKKNVRFYVKWLEVAPGMYICRECERRHMWPNMIQYKLPGPYQSFKKIVLKEDEAP